MGNVNVTPREEYLGVIADLLLSTKKSANEYKVPKSIPLLGGTGIGDLFMGKAPELVDDISYDGIKRLLKGGNGATGGIGTYTLDPRVMDAAMLGVDVGALSVGASKIAKSGSQKLLEKALSQAHKPTRREFLKKSAAIGGVAGGASLVPGAIRKIAKIADGTVDNVADNVATTAVKNHKYNTLQEYLDDVYSSAEDIAYEENYIRAMEEGYGNTPDFDKYMDFLRDEGISFNRAARQKLLDDEKMYKQAKQNVKDGLEPPPYEVRFNPDGKAETTEWVDVFSPQAKKEMKEYKGFVNQYRGGNWSVIDDITDYINGDRIPF